MRRLPLLLVFLAATACGGDDDGGGSSGLIPPGASVAPGELPTAAQYVEIEGTAVGISQGYACALTSDRKIICWGELKYQHLLQLNTLGKTGVEVKLPSPPTSFAMGGDGGCATVEDGSLRCWGNAIRGNTGAGQIGAPEPGESVSIGGFTGKVDYVHLGESNSTSACAISAGKPYCWDLGRDGVAHELGGGITDAKLVAANSEIQCVVRADDKLYCWGSNDFSQLGVPIGGTGTDAPPRVTTPTEVPDLTNVTAVEIDGRSVCAVSKGEVHCWGDRWYAGMKDEERQAAVPKTKVQGLTNVTKLRRERSSFCAIADGGAYCWDGGSSSSSVALKIEEPGATDIAVGFVRCGVFANNRVKCWGYSSVVNGDGGFKYHPVPTFVPGVTGAKKLFADPSGACVLDQDNHATCFGGASSSYRTASSMKAIGDGHAQRWPALDNATFIGFGVSYLCGVVNGAIVCASEPTDTAPQRPFSSLTNVVDFAMSPAGGCARLTDGTLSCWSGASTPAVVTGLTGVKAVVATSGRVAPLRICILQEGVKCWNGAPGANDATRFATPLDKLAAATDLHSTNGTLWCGLTPSGVACDIDVFGIPELKGDISGTSGASLLAVGGEHACAVVGGRVQCWGSGASGQLGSGNFSQAKAAFPVANANTPVALAAGAAFTCGLLDDGRVQCWGSNETGIVSPPPQAHELPNQVKVIY